MSRGELAFFFPERRAFDFHLTRRSRAYPHHHTNMTETESEVRRCVWCVTKGEDYEGTETIAIFDNKHDAEEFCAELIRIAASSSRPWRPAADNSWRQRSSSLDIEEVEIADPESIRCELENAKRSAQAWALCSTRVNT